MTNITIDNPLVIDHIARIEGKAGILVTIKDNKLDKVQLNIIEGPRFFEQICVGKSFEEAVAVFPRICSFCAAAHKITAVQAAEDAIGLQPSRQTQLLRELMYLGDQIESHALHLFLLAIPDFLGYPDAFAMAKEYKGAVTTALSLKDIGAKIQDVIGSRYIHQENCMVGGFGKLPTKNQLRSIKMDLNEVLKPSEIALEVLSKFDLWSEVNFERQHLALKPSSAFDNNYNFLGKAVRATDGSEFPDRDYQKHIKESVVPHSFAKHSSYKNKPFMTGALSRFTLFKDKLYGRGKELGNEYMKFMNKNNPMANNFAQAVEMVYFVERAIQLTDHLIENLDKNEKRIIPKVTKAGSGFSITEAPRGMVAYNLQIDENARVTKADVITPTAMFMPIMEADVGRMAMGLLDKGFKDVEVMSKELETIVRSYDPCVSCSVHVTKLK